MPSYYKNTTGFSYFQVPDRLMELRPQLQNFAVDLWLLVHCAMQHNTRSPNVLLTDDQIANHPSWGGRSINPREISKARTALKKHGLLHYRKDGQAWLYFCTHPITGKVIDPTEAARQAQDAKDNSELARAKAELAALKAQIASQAQPIVRHSDETLPKLRHSVHEYEDTGQVEEGEFVQ
jgi:hypothetical protein